MTKILNDDQGAVQMSPSRTHGSDCQEFGSRVLRLRQAYGISQRELAKRAGVTNGAISMIEQNRVSPSVASLSKILDVFGLSLSEFFASDFSADVHVFFPAGELPMVSEGAVNLRQIGGDQSNRRMLVLHEVYTPGGGTGDALLSHDGEEAGVVVRGEIEITVGGQCQILRPGDGYYFNSRMPHRFRNISSEDCEIVSSCLPGS
jgi:transcriptional regulator with XRE-family HTH domain